MEQSSFDRFTLSSDYSLDTSKYHFSNPGIKGEYNDAAHTSHQASFNSSDYFPQIGPHTHEPDFIQSDHTSSIIYQLRKENENSRLRETNQAWLNFRDQALKLGRIPKEYGFSDKNNPIYLDGSSINERRNTNISISNQDSNRPDALNPNASYNQFNKSYSADLLEKRKDVENDLKSKLTKSNEYAARLKIKLEQSLTRCELSQVSYTRMKECYDELLDQHQQLLKKVDMANEQELTTKSTLSKLKNELDLVTSQFIETKAALNESKEELEFWVNECQRFKRDYLYYRMAADDNAKKIEQLNTIIKEKEADFKALEEEYFNLLKLTGKQKGN